MINTECEKINVVKLFILLKEWTLKRQSMRMYFRGEKSIDENNINYKLQPSLLREKIFNLLSSKWSISKNATPLDLESKLLKRYKIYTAHLIEIDAEFSGRTLNDLEILCLAQHYGLPTLLLDWTLNPSVALYFALADDTGDLSKGDGRLWVMELVEKEKRGEMTRHLEESLDNREIEKKY